MIAAPGRQPETSDAALEPLADITLVAAGVALAMLVVEAGLWIGARRSQRRVEAVQREELPRASERRADA
jgi:hypothetical protein